MHACSRARNEYYNRKKMSFFIHKGILTLPVLNTAYAVLTQRTAVIKSASLYPTSITVSL